MKNPKILAQLIIEYSDSLSRVEGERDHQKAIAQRAEAECAVLGADFKKVAMARHKDKLAKLRDEIGGQMALIDELMGTP
jgi:hypothetical protein